VQVEIAKGFGRSAQTLAARQRIRERWDLLLIAGALFAAGWLLWHGRSESLMWRGFDGERAFEDLQNVVNFGPRPPGSAALAATGRYITTELSTDGVEIWPDNFTASTPVGSIPMTNIIGVIPGRSDSVVMVGGHYDTARLEGIRFVGANDGGSSTALLLELARVLAARKNKLTYWLVFFDGEEALKQWSASDSLYGSRHLAAQLEADGRLKRIRALVLVDMVAGRRLDILRESNSTPWLTDLVFKSACRLGYSKAFGGERFPVEDDHMPFLARGIPAVDIIDLTPFKSYHHTAQDTIDKCDPQSLTAVGRVVLATLAELERRISSRAYYRAGPRVRYLCTSQSLLARMMPAVGR